MAEPNKDTIYIDIDDEITGVIDKLRNSSGKIVALVLPKRASVFQSIVNMKLLKRAADDAKKNIVLITAEAGLLPLAGAAGVHVAKTLTSKPEIPSAPTLDDATEEAVEDDEEPDEITSDTAGDQPIGKLAGLGTAAAAGDGVETLELDDDETPEEAAAADQPKGRDFKPPKQDKKLKIPDFNRFRLWLILGGVVLILLIVGLVLAMKILPKATIDISTDATNVNSSLNLNLDTSAKSLSTANNTLPAKVVSQAKTYSQSVTTTGTKNEGNKATGMVTLTNCGNSNATVSSGTALSSSGNTYITQNTVIVPDSDFTSPGSGSKCKDDGQASVNVTAQSGGSNYNLSSGATFTVTSSTSCTSSCASGLSGQSGTISGGTDANVQVVSQADIDNATSKISTTNSTVEQTLENQLQQAGYYAIPATFTPGSPTTSSSANVGDTANSVTVTEAITYTMFGVHESDLTTLVDNNVDSQINTSKQSVLNDGLSSATFNLNSSTATTAQLLMSVTAVAGPQLNTTSIKQAAAGLKSGDIKSQIETNPDVTGVTVKLSPFWVTSAPKNTSKITVNIAKPTKAASNANSP
jgi:hypothetical protein